MLLSFRKWSSPETNAVAGAFPVRKNMFLFPSMVNIEGVTLFWKTGVTLHGKWKKRFSGEILKFKILNVENMPGRTK